MNHWEKHLRELQIASGAVMITDAIHTVKSQRLEVLRECLWFYANPNDGKEIKTEMSREIYENNKFTAKRMLNQWLSRGDLTQEEYDSLIKEFNL